MSGKSPVISEPMDKYGQQLSYDPEFRGPVKSRSCTDIICLFLFVSFIAGWVVISIFAFREGDPKVLLYPTDSAGNICGVGDLENKPYLFFFDLMKCANPSIIISGCLTPQVCVEQCPNKTFYAPSETSRAEEVKKNLICKYDVKKEEKDLNTLLNEGHCAKLYLKSTPVVGRCIPDVFHWKYDPDQYVKDDKNRTVTVDGQNEITVEAVRNATERLATFLSLGEFGERLFADFKTSWKYLLVGLVLSMAVSLLWIVLMRWLAAPMVWLSMLAVLAFSVYGCYYSTTKYIELKDVEDYNAKFRITLNLKSYLAMKKTWLAFAIISGSVFGILFLVLLFLRKRIYIAIALIKQASKAVGSMPTTLLLPIVPYFLMVVVFIFWTVVALYIASSGKASFVIADAPSSSSLKNGSICNPKSYNMTGDGVKCLFREYGLRDNIFSSHFYNLFAFFWGVFFAVGVGQVALASAFSAYYWTRDKSKDLPCCAAFTGLAMTMRYHLGSVAFGSLLISIIRMIRVILEYIDKKVKKYDNPLTRAILCCMKCCFWLLEKLLKFISKNAYIMIAIYGKSFCNSAQKAFFLLMRNILRVVVVDKLTDFLLLLGKLSVVAISGGTAFYLFSTDQKVVGGLPSLHYSLMPPIVITIGGYLIASGFFSVYEMAVDTLFLCFLEDCERNDGSPERPYLMSKELMKILHKRNKFQDLSSNRK